MNLAKQMKITVMHLIGTSFFGGPEKQIIQHLSMLNKSEKFRGILASFVEKNQENETLIRAGQLNIPHCGINVAGALDMRAVPRLASQIVNNNVRILCVHGYKSVVLGYIVAWLHKIPVIAFSRGYTSENIKVCFYEWLERKFLSRCDAIICVAYAQKEILKHFNVTAKKKFVVHNAVTIPTNTPNPSNHNSLKKAYNLPENSCLLISAGRLSPEKGHDCLIQAISIAKEKSARIYLLICGDGIWKKHLESLLSKYNVGDRCKLLGFRRDMNNILQEMDIFVLPSRTEGLPNVILESFAYAKPVIATKVGGVPEIVKHNYNGILVPSESPRMMADAIIKLSNDPKKRKEMGAAGLHTVSKSFTFEKQYKKLESIYFDIFKPE